MIRTLHLTRDSQKPAAEQNSTAALKSGNSASPGSQSNVTLLYVCNMFSLTRRGSLVSLNLWPFPPVALRRLWTINTCSCRSKSEERGIFDMMPRLLEVRSSLSSLGGPMQARRTPQQEENVWCVWRSTIPFIFNNRLASGYLELTIFMKPVSVADGV